MNKYSHILRSCFNLSSNFPTSLSGKIPNNQIFKPLASFSKMGNAASCTPSLIANGVFKVLFLDGRLESYTKPMKAAELMLEYPGQFVCDSSYLKVGHRIQGLLADEELERRKFYFLLPMELLYSVLTHEEMSSLNYKASRALKHGSFNNLSKIFPVCMFLPSEPKIIEADSEVISEPEHVERYSKQRSWRPALETIDETP